MRLLTLLTAILIAQTTLASPTVTGAPEYIATPTRTLVDLPALPDHNDGGKVFDFKKHASTIFVIEAYFLNCPYCQRNAPAFHDLAARFEMYPNVKFVEIGRDCRDWQYRQWIQTTGATGPVLNDCGGRKFLNKIGVRSYPTTLVVNCHGEVVLKSVGLWNSNTVTQIETSIDRSSLQCG